MKVGRLGRADATLVYGRVALAAVARPADVRAAPSAYDPMGQLFSDAMASLAPQQEQGQRAPKRRRVARDVEHKTVKDKDCVTNKGVSAEDSACSEASSGSDYSEDEDDLATKELELRKKPKLGGLTDTTLETVGVVVHLVSYV